MTEKKSFITLRGITYAYPGCHPVIRGLDFTLYEGDRIGLISPNGSGKTTLFHLVMGLLKPASGTIEIFGRPVSEEKEFAQVRRRIGLLFQDADDQLFSPTVLEDVAFGPLNLGKSKQEAIDISQKTLSFLGLKGFEDRITYKLSGGEKRLVALATVLAMEPDILLLDEPTGGLDRETTSRLENILNGLDISFILISHDVDFLSGTANQVYTMENGKIFIDDHRYLHTHKHAHHHGKIPHEHA
jgi:cobalt/nickel transport system ATP-binding protein